MKLSYLKKSFIIFISFYTQAASSTCDVTILGEAKVVASLANLPINVIKMLKNDLKLNYIPTGLVDLEYIPQDLREIITSSSKTPGNVSLLLDGLQWKHITPADFVSSSHIKIAYSMVEGTAVHKKWVDILNEKFDAVAVPDSFYEKVYRKSGVNIPIFVLPHIMDLKKLLELPLKEAKNSVFTFGMIATPMKRKNHKLVLEAFKKAFGNDPMVKLKLQVKIDGNISHINEIKDQIQQLGLTNVELIERSLSPEEYNAFLASLDAYVFLSKAEGFSLTPREAMAAGVPVILSNNTAHKTICKTGLVLSVKSKIAEPAYYDWLGEHIGYSFNCSLEDASKALLEMYNNYEVYSERDRLLKARDWVSQYDIEKMKPYWLSLLKPKTVYLGKSNKIGRKSLTTDSKSLYEKYITLSKISQNDLSIM